MNDARIYEKFGIPFHTGHPKVEVIGESFFNEEAAERFAEYLGYEAREDQLRGSDGEQIIEFAARSCYLSLGKGRNTEDHLDNIRMSDHGSVARHATVNLAITGVSRGLTHELVRHAAGTAISQSSSRYCNARDLGFVIPWEDRNSTQEIHSYESECEIAMMNYELRVDRAIVNGVGRKVARGAARERLPIGLNQVMVFSFNTQSFRHVLRMRGSSHAEQQIRALARVMAPIAVDLWPHICDDIEIVKGCVEVGANI